MKSQGDHTITIKKSTVNAIGALNVSNPVEEEDEESEEEVKSRTPVAGSSHAHQNNFTGADHGAIDKKNLVMNKAVKTTKDGLPDSS